MATFDVLIDDLASRFGLGVNARTLVEEVLTMISTSPGGFSGFLDKLKSSGLTSEVASWLGRPDAAPIAAGLGRARAWADCAQRDCGPPRPGTDRGLDRARIRLAEDRRTVDAQGRRQGRGPCRSRGVSFAAAGRGGSGAGRAKADRRSPSKRREPVQRRALAMAGAHRAGRHRAAFLFLVDVQPHAVRAARRKGAGACARRRRPSAGSAASGASPCLGASAGNRGGASAGPCPGCFDERTSDRSADAAGSLDRCAGDDFSSACRCSCAAAGSATARRHFACDDRTGCGAASSRSRREG